MSTALEDHDALDGEDDDDAVAEQDEDLEACPCCGSLTIEEPGAHDICEVCWWEDDDLDRDRPDRPSGPNGPSLNEARENVRRFGACDERHRASARPPRPWERPAVGRG